MTKLINLISSLFRKPKYTDSDLLEAVCQYYRITRQGAINIWIIQSKKNGKQGNLPK